MLRSITQTLPHHRSDLSIVLFIASCHPLIHHKYMKTQLLRVQSPLSPVHVHNKGLCMQMADREHHVNMVEFLAYNPHSN